MPLHFLAAHGSAVDSANSLVIYEPRMQPGSRPDEVEYQYAIYKHDGKRDGLGCYGLSVLIEEAGELVRLYTLDLGQPQVVESMLKLKQRLHIDGDDFEFIHRLAEGLVRAFQSRTDNVEAIHYVALTQEKPLRNVGLVAPADLRRLPNGHVLLAESRVAAHPIVGLSP